jgi:hypothetical protein
MRRPGKIALLSVLLVLVSIGVAYAVGRAAQGPEPSKQVASKQVDVSAMVRSDHGGCRGSEDPPIKIPPSLYPRTYRVLVSPTVIGCGRRMGGWFRLVAHLRAHHRSRELCYGLEQPSRGATSGGACVHVSAGVPICHAQCRIGPSGLNPGRNGVSKVTVVSGAVEGRVENLRLSSPDRSLVPGPRPIVAVMSGTLARKFGLRRDLSIFAYLVEPCLTAGQKVAVVAAMEGGRRAYLRGTAPAECG